MSATSPRYLDFQASTSVTLTSRFVDRDVFGSADTGRFASYATRMVDKQVPDDCTAPVAPCFNLFLVKVGTYPSCSGRRHLSGFTGTSIVSSSYAPSRANYVVCAHNRRSARPIRDAGACESE